MLPRSSDNPLRIALDQSRGDKAAECGPRAAAVPCRNEVNQTPSCFATGHLKIGSMIRAGLFLNLTCTVAITLLMTALIHVVWL